MAPRRGGGGGGFGFSTSSCNSDAFYLPESRAFVACYALFILGYLGLLSAFSIVRKKHAAAKNLLTWSYVGLSMLFYWCSYVASLVLMVLNECGTIGYIDYFKGDISVVVFSRLGDILLLGAIMLQLAPYLQTLIGSNPKTIKIIHGIVWGVVSAILLAYAGLSGYSYGHMDDFYTNSYVDEANKLGAAAYILYLLAAGVAVVNCIISLVQMNSRRVARGSLAVLIPLLGISMLLWPILIVVLRVYYGLQDHGLTYVGSVVYEYLIDTFQFLVYVFLLLIASSPAVAAGARTLPTNGAQPVYAPVQGSEYQPVYVGPQQYQAVPQPGYQGYGGYQPQPPQQQYAYQAPQQYQVPQQQTAYQAPEVRHISPVASGGVHELPK